MGAVLKTRGTRGENIPRSALLPGILAMMDGWLKEWVNLDTVMAELAEATLLTVSNNHDPASVPYELL